MKVFSILLTLFLSLQIIASQSEGLQNARRITLELPDGMKVKLSDKSFDLLFSKWTQKEMVDPNSKTTHVYEGFYLKDFIKHVIKVFGVKEPVEVVTMAKDGYKLALQAGPLNDKSAFFALAVNGVPKDGLYSQYLKRKFKWQPAYIIAGGKGTGIKSVSPYQITKLTWVEKALKNPILSRVETPFQKGAEVFVETCSKCHRHKGFGGKKAPAMKLVLRKWKNKSDQELKSFLRAPQETVKRKIQMSAFQGKDADLDALVKFLRHIN